MEDNKDASGDETQDLSKMMEHWSARPRDRRNRPCKCGSGKKFKKCCLRNEDSGKDDPDGDDR